jgi:hypothetical protein
MSKRDDGVSLRDMEFIRFDGHLDKIQVDVWNGKSTARNSKSKQFD